MNISDIVKVWVPEPDWVSKNKACNLQGVEELPDLPEQVLEREEEGGELCRGPVDVERPLLLADEQAVHDGQPGDGEHQAGVAVVHRVLGHQLLLDGSHQRLGEQHYQVLQQTPKEICQTTASSILQFMAKMWLKIVSKVV